VSARGRILFASAIAVVMVCAEFLAIIHSDISLPSAARIALAFLNLIPVAAALAVAGGDGHGPNLLVVGIVAFLQWFLVGFLVSLLFGRPRRPS
jgi:hypothetical protein